MNCAKIEKLLPLYTAGDLTGREMESVGAHLSSCDFCRNLSAEFAASRERLRNFPVPEFGSDFYAGIRGAVMKEISRSPRPARPSIFQALFALFPRHSALATSLATLALVGLLSFALYLSLAKRETALTAIERSMAEINLAVPPENTARPLVDKVISSSAEVRQPATIAGGGARRMPEPGAKRAARPGNSVPQDIDNAVPNVDETVAQTSGAPRDEAPGQAVARMDIQTGDPNIRIIWLARKASE